MIKLICTIVLCAASVLGADFYCGVSATGNGSGSDWNNQCAFMSTTTNRGNTYWLADGSYGGRNFNRAVSGTLVITIKKATVADHGTATGWDNAYGDGQAFFGSIAVNSDYWVINGNRPCDNTDVRTCVRGFVFQAAEGGGYNVSVVQIGAVDSQKIEFYSVELRAIGVNELRGFRFCCGNTYNNTVVSNAAIYNTGNDALHLNKSQNVLLEKLYISGPGEKPAGSGAHPDAFEFVGSPFIGGTKNTLRYSIIEWNGQQMWWSGGSDPVNNPISHGEWDIYGNQYIGRLDAAAFVSTSTFKSRDEVTVGPINIYNNTIVGTWNIFDLPNAGTNGLFRNNALFRIWSTANKMGGGADRFTKTHNYYDTEIGNQDASNGQTGGDPFVDLDGKNLALAFATTAGQTFSSPISIDMFGVTRGADGTWDRGALEFVAGGSVALNITTSSLPDGVVGVAYDQTVTAIGGAPPYTFTVQTGSLPGGLSLSTSGQITGTPTTAESQTFTVRVTDDDTTTDDQSFTVAISTVAITSGSSLSGLVARDFSFTLEATGGTTPYAWTVSSGSLPSGLSLNSSTGAITGAPTSAGITIFSITVTDDNSATDVQEVTMTVTAPSTNFIDTGLVVRYFFDEAASGSTPTQVIDRAQLGEPFNLDIDYGTAALSYTTVSSNKGLASSALTGAHRVDRFVGDAADSVREALQEKQTVTIELKLRVDSKSSGGAQSRVFGFTDSASDIGRLMLKMSGSANTFTLGFNNVNVESWDVAFSSLDIWHIVIDTTLGTADGRVVVYQNGTPVTTTSTTAITQNANLDMSTDQWLIGFNRPTLDRSFTGRLAYAAVYGHAFTSTEVTTNYDLLLANDDTTAQATARLHSRGRGVLTGAGSAR